MYSYNIPFDLAISVTITKTHYITGKITHHVTDLAVVFLTYSSMLSMSGLMVEIMVASPAALAKLEIISRPSTLA